jgi:hypothetical protein
MRHEEIKLGTTVHLRAQSGEIIEGRVVHLWEDKSVQMVRVNSDPPCPSYPARRNTEEAVLRQTQNNRQLRSWPKQY